ncbi:MAG TPA: tyrosine-type recombinase/integrase [Thermoleophilaceae bacterium]|nr:tyrosine-type recombinase/integrase [Thermoleophilaceae bacterium]
MSSPGRSQPILVQHKLASLRSTPGDFVFASRSGRPLGQRNVLRALRRAQERAVDGRGQPTFPALHEHDERGRRVPQAPGALPTFHSFRHTAASHAIAAGESAEEVSWQLGHRNSVVTRAIYVHELKTAERTARRRQRMEAQSALFLSSTAMGAESPVLS